VGLGAVLPAVFLFALKAYQRARLLTFLNPEADRSGAGYHIIQSKIALGSGGLLGKGFGLGSQSQLNFLPEKSTDFIFASLAEEFGFVGCVSILLLYAAVIFMALRMASLATAISRACPPRGDGDFRSVRPDQRRHGHGSGPVVGVPMPLLSFGGTVMITMMVGFALVLSVRVHRYSEVSSGKAAPLDLQAPRPWRAPVRRRYRALWRRGRRPRRSRTGPPARRPSGTRRSPEA